MCQLLSTVDSMVYRNWILSLFLKVDVRLNENMLRTWKRGVVQSVERATLGEEVPSSIPAVAARSLLIGSVSVLCDRLRQKPWSPSSVSCVAARKIVRCSVLGPVRDTA